MGMEGYGADAIYASLASQRSKLDEFKQKGRTERNISAQTLKRLLGKLERNVSLN